MTHNLLIRGFDDDIHSQLGDLSRQRGVTINSIVKDAVDQWLKKQSEIPKRHHLLLYDNDESMKYLLKLLDKLTREDEWFRCFVRSSSSDNNSSVTELLKKLEWFDGTIIPYKMSQKNTMEYIVGILQNISKNSNNRELCLVDFLIDDIAKESVKEANFIEKEYDKDRLQGLVFCAYNIKNLINSSTTNMIEMFELHDQVFILNNNKIYKLHITTENIHKLFLS